MNKKFSIVKTVDLNKLEDEIDKYIMQTGETRLHIFMHIDTMNAINKALPTILIEPVHMVHGTKGAISYWEGQPVFIDNELEFGEVEIRQSECKHEWHVVGSVAGTKSRYEVFVCPKCGRQETRKTIFNRKDGTYKVVILDEDNT